MRRIGATVTNLFELWKAENEEQTTVRVRLQRADSGDKQNYRETIHTLSEQRDQAHEDWLAAEARGKRAAVASSRT